MWIRFYVSVVSLGYVLGSPIPLEADFNEPKLDPDVGLNVLELIEKHGYPLEQHMVKTEDDYLLSLQRIPHGRNSNSTKSRRPVLLVPGLLCSSADYVNMGPERSLGFILADMGYDVWLANPRGTTWSRKHMFLDPNKDKAEFWDFSWHEIGIYDLPATIDFVLQKTGYKQLHYIGHSQGTTSFFVMASTKPEYNEKIRLMSALAPVAFMSKIPNVFFKLIASQSTIIGWITKFIGLYEFLPNTELLPAIGKVVCDENAWLPQICSSVLFLIAGYDSEQLDPPKLPVIVTNTPAGAATKQLLHYAQGINNKDQFRQYDYGWMKNLQIYGSRNPPVYDLSKITAPIALHYSSNDLLSSTKDVALLKEGLKKTVVYEKMVPFAKFNHLDFLWAKDVVELLYNDVVNEMEKY